MKYELTDQHMKLFKAFKKCVDNKSIESMNNALYDFFYLRCGFIAHYDIHGFKHTYSGNRFLEWFKVFAEPDWLFVAINRDEYGALRHACSVYAIEKAQEVYDHFSRLAYNKKVALMHKLAEELNHSVVPLAAAVTNSQEDVEQVQTLFFEKNDGQLSLFI